MPCASEVRGYWPRGFTSLRTTLELGGRSSGRPPSWGPDEISSLAVRRIFAGRMLCGSVPRRGLRATAASRLDRALGLLSWIWMWPDTAPGIGALRLRRPQSIGPRVNLILAAGG